VKSGGTGGSEKAAMINLSLRSHMERLRNDMESFAYRLESFANYLESFAYLLANTVNNVNQHLVSIVK
jgi:hypothetical protein